MITGVNRMNIAWLSTEAEKRIVDDMADHGVTFVRFSLSKPYSDSLAAVRHARQRGMEVLLEVPLHLGEFYIPNTPKRTGFERSWDMRRLSDINLRKFQAFLRDTLRDLDSTATRILAIEPGNELNWAPYNGDLHIYKSGKVKTAQSPAELQDRERFLIGLDLYVDIVRIIRAELERTKVNTLTRIVSAGLADVPQSIADNDGMEQVSSLQMINLLRQRGIDRWIDAYGVHIYPSRQIPADARRRRIVDLLSFCKVDGGGKPCWITEWGVANTDESCPSNDTLREGLIRELKGVFEHLASTGKIEATFYFDWDSKTPYSVWRCSNLTSAGEAAIKN
jgi:hypothetical protein